MRGCVLAVSESIKFSQDGIKLSEGQPFLVMVIFLILTVIQYFGLCLCPFLEPYLLQLFLQAGALHVLLSGIAGVGKNANSEGWTLIVPG